MRSERDCGDGEKGPLSKQCWGMIEVKTVGVGEWGLGRNGWEVSGKSSFSRASSKQCLAGS